MYTSFRIQNFKGFKDLAFDDLARVNLIAGKNNTGKTSVLEAIVFHSGRYWISETLRIRNMPKSEPDIFDRREFQDGELPDWNTLFYNFDPKNAVVIEGDHGEKPIQSLSKWTVTVEQPDDENKELHAPGFHGRIYDFIGTDKIGAVKITVTSSHSSDSPMTIYAPADDSISGFVKEWQDTFRKLPVFLIASDENGKEAVNTDLFTKIDNSDAKNHLLQVLRAVDLRIVDVKIQTQYGVPRLVAELQGLEKPAQLSTLGDGFTRLVYIFATMAVIQGGVILIDEIENGLHYSVLPDVWRAIDEASKLFNVQVFATTHSREVIRAAHAVFSEDKDLETEGYDFRYHRLGRHVKTGEIGVTTYEPGVLEASFDMNLEMR